MLSAAIITLVFWFNGFDKGMIMLAALVTYYFTIILMSLK